MSTLALETPCERRPAQLEASLLTSSRTTTGGLTVHHPGIYIRTVDFLIYDDADISQCSARIAVNGEAGRCSTLQVVQITRDWEGNGVHP